MFLIKAWALLGASLLFGEKLQAAATVVWQFEVTITSANPASSIVSGDLFHGELSYEDSSTPTISAPSITDPDLSLTFKFNDEVFDNSDDKAIGYPLFIQDPTSGLTFCVDLEKNGYSSGAFFHIYPDNTFQYSIDGNSEYEGEVTFQLVPEPSPLVLLLSGGLVAVLTNRKRK